MPHQTSTLSRTDNAVLDTGEIDYLAEGFSALADPNRLRIVHLLMTQGEMCVCEFMPLLDLTQSNISFHLKTLKQAGFIVSRKDGRWMLYSLDRTAFERFEDAFRAAFDLGRWPEKTASAPDNEAIRRRLACQQDFSQESHQILIEKGANDNANE